MNYIFSILIVLVLHLAPANVNKFTMQMDDKETLQFTKQADGGWSAVMPSKKDTASFYIEGSKLTVKSDGQEHTQDFAEMLGVDKDTDWKSLKEFKVGALPVQIDRKDDGLDFIISENSGGAAKHAFKVRWDAK